MLLAPLAAEAWHTDLGTARDLAQAADRDLLILFTGSDWCTPCQRQERQVLSQPAFLAAASERFVLVKLDFLKRTPLGEERQAALDAAQATYAVHGFPTLVLARPDDGSRYAATGYRQELDASAYLAHLDELASQRDTEPDLVAAIDAADDPAAEARAWDALIRHRDHVRSQPVTLADLQALLAADPEDTSGLCAPYAARLAREERDERLMAARRSGERDAIKAIIDEGLADERQDGDYRQGLRYAWAYTLMHDDKAAAADELDRAIAEDPANQRVPDLRRFRDAMRRAGR